MSRRPDMTHPPGEIKTDAAERLRYVYIERARCPVCESTDLLTTHSTDQGDGTVKRNTKCRECSHKFLVIVE